MGTRAAAWRAFGAADAGAASSAATAASATTSNCAAPTRPSATVSAQRGFSDSPWQQGAWTCLWPTRQEGQQKCCECNGGWTDNNRDVWFSGALVRA